MAFIYLVGTVLGLGIAVLASRRALSAAVDLGAVLRLSPFLIGVTILAIGTDLPEIANSLIASAGGHGDLNVGDSHGSVVTQMTLVLGLLCLTGKLVSTARDVIIAGALTVAALIIASLLFFDGWFGRLDGLVLIAAWIGGSIVLYRADRARQTTPTSSSDSGQRDRSAGAGAGDRAALVKPLARTFAYLALVGLGSAIAVESFTEFARDLGAPQYLMSFFILALGTSLPELVVDGQALRRSRADLALGDLLGSSFVDATLSPGIGPLFFPTALSDTPARAALIVAAVMAVVVAVLARDQRHRWPTGVVLILLYVGLYPALVT